MKTLSRKIGSRFRAAWAKVCDNLRRPPVATLLALLVAVIAALNGASMIFNPRGYIDSPVYQAAMRIAIPEAWGMLFIIAGVLLVSAVLKSRKDAELPLVALSWIFGLFGALTVSSVAHGGPASPVWLWTGYGVVGLIAQYALKEEHNVNSITDSHQH